MKIFVCCSKHLYHRIKDIRERLEAMGHELTMPNKYEDPFHEERMKEKGHEIHSKWKGEMIRLQGEKVEKNDAILVLNFDKKGQPNYIGGATFLEIFKAFELGKKIFLMNPVPDNIFRDELIGMNPIIIDGDLTKIES